MVVPFSDVRISVVAENHVSCSVFAAAMRSERLQACYHWRVPRIINHLLMAHPSVSNDL